MICSLVYHLLATSHVPDTGEDQSWFPKSTEPGGKAERMDRGFQDRGMRAGLGSAFWGRIVGTH